jgi:hypothetical protein
LDADKGKKLSVPGHAGINVGAPALDPACHALRVGDSLAPKPINNVGAANSVVAKYDHGCVVCKLIQAIEMSGDRVHRNQFRAIDPGDLVFIGPADVNEYQTLPSIKSLFHFRGGYFEREGFKHHSILFAGAFWVTRVS